MNLQTYIQTDRGNATRLAASLGIPLTYLSQMASGNRSVSAERAVAIEQHTKVVTRKDLFPDNWQSIWPELSRKQKAVA